MDKRILAGVVYILGLAVFVIITATQISAGTIATAQARGQESDSVRKKGNELGLTCITRPEKCGEMITRAEKNPRLKEALLKAKAAKVGIHPGDWSELGLFAGRIGNGYIVVNISRSDESIIAFLTN